MHPLALTNSFPLAVKRGENSRCSTVAWEDKPHECGCVSLFPTPLASPFPELLLLKVTSYGTRLCCFQNMNINKMLGYIIFSLG